MQITVLSSLEDREYALRSDDALLMEIHLVNEITSEGGVRTLPTKEALSQFTKRYSLSLFEIVIQILCCYYFEGYLQLMASPSS